MFDCQFLHVLFVAVELGGASVLTCESIYQICQQLIVDVNLTTEDCLEGHVDNTSDSTEVSAAEGMCVCVFLSVCTLSVWLGWKTAGYSSPNNKPFLSDYGKEN